MRYTSTGIIISIVIFQLNQIVLSDNRPFPYCESASNIRRVFNILNSTYLEEFDNGHSIYWTFDQELQQYIKADWLWMFAGANLAGVFWKGNDNDLQIITRTISAHLIVKEKIVQFNNIFNFFVDKRTPKITHRLPSEIELSEESYVYQINMTRYAYSPQKGLVYQYLVSDTSNIASLTVPEGAPKLNGIFEKGDSIYIYHNANVISTIKQISNVNKTSTYKFEDLFPCTKEVKLDILMLASAIIQGIIILILILVNILIVVSFLNYKKQTKQKSERVESKIDGSTSVSSGLSRVRRFFSRKPENRTNRAKSNGTRRFQKGTVSDGSIEKQSISTSNSVVKCYIKNKRNR